MTTPAQTMYGRTVYFDKGKRAEIMSEYQEWTDDLARLIADAPRAPRVLARITEDDPASRYALRCESCEFVHDSPSLANVTRAAENHAIVSGHAVLVEAL